MRVAVVTDSASDLPARPLGVTAVVPIDRTVGADLPQSTYDGADGTRCGVLTAVAPEIAVLSERFVSLYERLSAGYDAILSVHASSRLSPSCEAAREARARLRGVVPISVVDSGTAGIALGFGVARLGRAASGGASLPQLEVQARRVMSNVHAMFFAESLDQISQSPRFGRARAWPIHGNGMRPLLQVEDGEMRPLERVRTRARGYDRLAEFVELFPSVDSLAIYHDATATEIEPLVRRITPLYPRDRIIFGAYGPTLRSQLGARAIGVFVDQGPGAD